MNFVDDDVGDSSEVRITSQPAKKNACRTEEKARFGGPAALQANRITYLCTASADLRAAPWALAVA